MPGTNKEEKRPVRNEHFLPMPKKKERKKGIIMIIIITSYGN